jgi:hypothetical protein
MRQKSITKLPFRACDISRAVLAITELGNLKVVAIQIAPDGGLRLETAPTR